MDSARANLAGTFVNGGFGNDKLMVEAEKGNSWIYGMCVHRLSFLIVSDMDNRHNECSCESWTGVAVGYRCRSEPRRQYTYSSEEHIKAGALFTTGFLNTGI